MAPGSWKDGRQYPEHRVLPQKVRTGYGSGRITENLEQVGKPVQCIIIDRVIYMCFFHLRILQTVNFYCS